jgi:hypothetical protein
MFRRRVRVEVGPVVVEVVGGRVDVLAVLSAVSMVAKALFADVDFTGGTDDEVKPAFGFAPLTADVQLAHPFVGDDLAWFFDEDE